MSHQPKPGAVVFAANVPRVAKFYEQLVSMAVKHAEQDKVVLETDTVLLVIHGIPHEVAAHIALTDPPQRRETTAVKLFLPVASIAQARAKAAALGGGVKPASAQWRAGEFTACDGFDPEGNIVQFRESAP